LKNFKWLGGHFYYATHSFASVIAGFARAYALLGLWLALPGLSHNVEIFFYF
jgi:hypothetical protein